MNSKDDTKNREWNAMEREMFFRYLDITRQVRESNFELSKQMYEIDTYEREHYKKELERQKSYINDLLDIIKFVIKLSATALIASFAPIDNFVGKETIFLISLGLLVFGTVGLIVLLNQRSKVEESYLDDMNNMQSTVQDYREAVLESSKLLNQESEMISEVIKKELESQS